MKTVILLLCLWGASLSLPMWQANRLLSASNSMEKQMMQLDNVLGNVPQQTQHQANPEFGLPPAQMVQEQITLQLHPQLSQDLPLDPTFGNLPVILQWSHQPGYQQLSPSINLVPLTTAFRQDTQPVNPAEGLTPITQKFPLTIGGMNALPQMLLPQQIYPIIVAQIGQQGMIVSSEEAESTFTGIFIPPFLPIPFPIGQVGVHVDGHDAILSVGGDGDSPAGQTGAVQGTATSAVSDGTLIHNEQDMLETVPAAVRKTVTEGSIFGEKNHDKFPPYTTPAGLIKPPDSVTDVVFVEPTALASMAPNEAKIVPYSELNVPAVPRNGKFIFSSISQGQKVNAPPRGDDHLPLKARDAKLLRQHKKRLA